MIKDERAGQQIKVRSIETKLCRDSTLLTPHKDLVSLFGKESDRRTDFSFILCTMTEDFNLINSSKDIFKIVVIYLPLLAPRQT